MAHFAELTDGNGVLSVVLRVVVVNNKDILDDEGNESEEVGVAFCKSLFGGHTNWVQTSYSGGFRNRFAMTGDIYAKELDAFIPPQPFYSWVFNRDTLLWEAPVPYPTEYTADTCSLYVWDEDSEQWVKNSKD